MPHRHPLQGFSDPCILLVCHDMIAARDVLSALSDLSVISIARVELGNQCIAKQQPVIGQDTAAVPGR